MDGRFISDYLAGLVPNQSILLFELESKGIESIHKSGILTIRNFGVPVTSLVLLLNDGLNKIKEFQLKLDNNIKSDPTSITQEQLPADLSIKSGSSTIGSWDKINSKGIDYSLNLSGSSAIGYSTWYIPGHSESPPPLDTIYYSSNQYIQIARDYIRVTETIPENNRQYLIEVFKDIISFLETAYTLKDRIQFEISEFKKVCGQIDFPNMPTEFNSICHKRGAIVHESSFEFDISEYNKLKFGKDQVVSYFEQGLKSAMQWINDIYGVMHRKLINP